MQKPEIILNYEDPSLEILKNFNERIASQFSKHRNCDIASRVIETLMYIKLNLDLIKYAVENKSDKTLYKYGRDQANSVLRATNDMSFHLNSYTPADGDKAVADFKELIAMVENGITLMGDNEEQIGTFISYIKDSDVGCLEVRLSDAMGYIGELTSDAAKKIKLVDLFGECNQEFTGKYAKQQDQLDPFLFFKQVLAFFKERINSLVDYKDTVSPLNWDTLFECAKSNFDFDIAYIPSEISTDHALLKVICQSLQSTDREAKNNSLVNIYLSLRLDSANENGNTWSKIVLFTNPLIAQSLIKQSLVLRLRHSFPEPFNDLLAQPAQKKFFIYKDHQFFQTRTRSLREQLQQDLKNGDAQAISKTLSICRALDTQNKTDLQTALGLTNMSDLIASQTQRPYVNAWLGWQLTQRFSEPLNSILDQPVIVNSKQTYLRAYLRTMLSDNLSNPKVLHKVLAVSNALTANNIEQLRNALDINRGFKVSATTTSRKIFDQAEAAYTPNTSLELAPAVDEAFQLYYGKSFNPSITTVEASNRPIHGIMHALGCMELIPKVHELYTKHVAGYTDEMNKIATLFGIDIPHLLKLLQHTALMHDSGRMGDGVDHWDAISADNLAISLEQKNVPKNLRELLQLTIRYKDDQNAFIQASKNIESGDYQFDYLRQVINMTDTLEVIRVRSEFGYNYLPILQRADDQFIDKNTLIKKIDHLVYTTAEKIHQESRTPLSKHTIIRQDDTKFLIKPKPAAIEDDRAFAMTYNRLLPGGESRSAEPLLDCVWIQAKII